MHLCALVLLLLVFYFHMKNNMQLNATRFAKQLRYVYHVPPADYQSMHQKLVTVCLLKQMRTFNSIRKYGSMCNIAFKYFNMYFNISLLYEYSIFALMYLYQ